MKGQNGFTLVELLLTMTITGIIVSFLGTAAYQTFTASEYGNKKMSAIHDLQNISQWLNRDGQMASDATGGSQLVLTLPDDSTITYALSGTELRRTANDSQITIGWNVTSAAFAVDDRTVTLTVTSSLSGRQDASQQGTYTVHLRPAEGED